MIKSLILLYIILSNYNRRIKKSTQKKAPIKKTKGYRKSAKALRKIAKKQRVIKYLNKKARKQKKREKYFGGLPRKLPTTISKWSKIKIIKSSINFIYKLHIPRYKLIKRNYILSGSKPKVNDYIYNQYSSFINKIKLRSYNLFNMTPNFNVPRWKINLKKRFKYTSWYFNNFQRTLRTENFKMINNKPKCKRTPKNPHKNMTTHIYKK